jgi:hypothetical protein
MNVIGSKLKLLVREILSGRQSGLLVYLSAKEPACSVTAVTGRKGLTQPEIQASYLVARRTSYFC